MGYLYILLAASANTYKGYCSKKVGKYTDCVSDNVHLSLLRNVVCVALGILILLIGRIPAALSGTGWLICAISGAAQTVSYIAWVMALKTDAFMFTSAVNNSAFILSVSAGVLLFGEKISVPKVIAVFLIITAMYFMLRFQIETKCKPKPKDILVLLLLFLSNGFTQITQKWFTVSQPKVSNHVFTLYTFLFAILLLVLFRLLTRYPKEKRGEQLPKIKSMTPYAALMGVLLYVVVFFQTQAAATVGAVVLYPINCGLSLVFSCFMAWIFFGEKPTRSAVIGAVFVFAALVMSRI